MFRHIQLMASRWFARRESVNMAINFKANEAGLPWTSGVGLIRSQKYAGKLRLTGQQDVGSEEHWRIHAFPKAAHLKRSEERSVKLIPTSDASGRENYFAESNVKPKELGH